MQKQTIFITEWRHFWHHYIMYALRISENK